MQLPKRVTLELSNRCNRKCEGCPRHSMDYPLGDMGISLLTKVTDQLPDNVCVVPFFRGDPLLNPQFIEATKILRRFREVQLATNGDFLTRAHQKAILDTCTFVSVSLHRYLFPHNTLLPSFFYDALGNGVETQVSILDTLIRDKTRFSRQWLNHVDQVRIYKTHSKNGFGSMEGEESPTEPCNKPFEEMVVYWDGEVGLCNHDWNNQTSLGNLHVQTIEDVWNGTLYEEARFFHSSERRRLVASCERCDFAPNHVYGELIRNG